MKIITVASEKGGVGKTTIATTLASIAADRGMRTLVVDLDPQANAGFALNADLALLSSTAAGLICRRQVAPQAIAERLSVLIGGPTLLDNDVQSAHSDELGTVLRALGSYDVVIIDTPPGDKRLVHQGLCAADAVVIPIGAHPFAMQGAQRIVGHVDLIAKRGRQQPVVVLALNNLNRSRKDDRDLDGALAKLFPHLKRVEIPQDAQIAGASRDQVPIVQSGTKGRGLLQLIALSALIGIIPQKESVHD